MSIFLIHKVWLVSQLSQIIIDKSNLNYEKLIKMRTNKSICFVFSEKKIDIDEKNSLTFSYHDLQLIRLHVDFIDELI